MQPPTGPYVSLMAESSLALAEMKLLLREVYSKMTTLPDPSMNEEQMAMDDQLVSSRPLGQRCLLKFSSIA